MASFQSNLEHLKALSVEDSEKTNEILCSVGYHKRLQPSSRPYISQKEFRQRIKRKSLKNGGEGDQPFGSARRNESVSTVESIGS